MIKKKIWITFSIIACVLVVSLLAGGLIITHYLNKIHHLAPEEMLTSSEEIVRIQAEEEADLTGEDEEEAAENAEILQPDDIIWVEDGTPIESSGLYNILLIGQDRRPGEGRVRSDSMILCSINIKTAKVSMVSFQRDTWVQIPGDADNRLNVAYRYGDIPLVYKTYEKNFGLKIDGTFAVDFDAFKAVIDRLGGVDVTLTANEASIVGTHSDANRLNGEQALAYSRIRPIDSEFKRTERQHKVMMSIYNEFKNAGPEKLLKTLNTLLPYISTDLNNGKILELAAKVIPLIPKLEINTFHVPFDGNYRNARIKGRAVFIPDLEAIREALENEILPIER